MEIAQIVLSVLTLGATALGWWVTAKSQRDLVTMARGHSMKDRELTEFRSRGRLFSANLATLCRRVVDCVTKIRACYALPVEFQGHQETRDLLRAAWNDLHQAMKDFKTLVFEPDYHYFVKRAPHPEWLKSVFDGVVAAMNSVPIVDLYRPDNVEQLSETLGDLAAHAGALASLVATLFAEVEASSASQ